LIATNIKVSYAGGGHEKAEKHGENGSGLSCPSLIKVDGKGRPRKSDREVGNDRPALDENRLALLQGQGAGG
jgi:hypothetical protein